MTMEEQLITSHTGLVASMQTVANQNLPPGERSRLRPLIPVRASFSAEPDVLFCSLHCLADNFEHHPPQGDSVNVYGGSAGKPAV